MGIGEGDEVISTGGDVQLVAMVRRLMFITFSS
jgi:hypothetical protein